MCVHIREEQFHAWLTSSIVINNNSAEHVTASHILTQLQICLLTHLFCVEIWTSFIREQKTTFKLQISRLGWDNDGNTVTTSISLVYLSLFFQLCVELSTWAFKNKDEELIFKLLYLHFFFYSSGVATISDHYPDSKCRWHFSPSYVSSTFWYTFKQHPQSSGCYIPCSRKAAVKQNILQ